MCATFVDAYTEATYTCSVVLSARTSSFSVFIRTLTRECMIDFFGSLGMPKASRSGSGGKEQIHDGMYDGLDEELWEGPEPADPDLMEKSKFMMECMMDLMTSLGRAKSQQIRICWKRANR